MGAIRSWAQVEEAADAIRRRCGDLPDTAIVLGSGLGEVADTVQDAEQIPYGELPHWPTPGVIGHAGRLVIGRSGSRRLAAFCGRAHLYEGYDPSAVVFGTRVAGRLGVKRIVLTNAAAGIREQLAPGVLMLIDDHINLVGSSPLIGPNDERFGPRFPDMTEVYSLRLRSIATQVATTKEIPLSHGVYAAVHGPSYETPAEVRFLRAIGADAVGMSTVPEAIAARHMGLEVLGISCIGNAAAGILPQPLLHTEVLENVRRASHSLAALVAGILERL